MAFPVIGDGLAHTWPANLVGQATRAFDTRRYTMTSVRRPSSPYTGLCGSVACAVRQASQRPWQAVPWI